MIPVSLVGNQDSGFQVFETFKADEVLGILVAHSEIEALVTGISVPASPDELKQAGLVRESHADVAIVFTSGHPKFPKNNLPRKIPFFSKSHEVGRVVNHIRELTFR